MRVWGCVYVWGGVGVWGWVGVCVGVYVLSYGASLIRKGARKRINSLTYPTLPPSLPPSPPQAYRNMAKIYHPDKQSDSSPEEKEKAEREFLKIAQAYEVG